MLYREVVFLTVTITSRFEIVDQGYNIEKLKNKSENENTKNSTDYLKNVLKKWVNERHFWSNLEDYESDVLDQKLYVINK